MVFLLSDAWFAHLVFLSLWIIKEKGRRRVVLSEIGSLSIRNLRISFIRHKYFGFGDIISMNLERLKIRGGNVLFLTLDRVLKNVDISKLAHFILNGYDKDVDTLEFMNSSVI